MSFVDALGASALPILFPGSNAGFGRAHVAIAAMAGASDCADDDIIDYKRQSARNENDLSLHQTERAMETLRIALQLICGFGSALLQ